MALIAEWHREPREVMSAARVVALHIAGTPTQHASFDLRLGQAHTPPAVA